jgi:hypothetical protein
MNIRTALSAVLIILISSNASHCESPEDKVFEFMINCEDVQKCFDVKCAVTSTVEHEIASEPEKQRDDALLLIDYRFTRNSDSFRLDAATYNIGELLDPERQSVVYSNLRDSEGKIWSAGMGKSMDGKSHFQGVLQDRVDPLSMLLLPMDSQSNGSGATHDNLVKLISNLEFVETLSDDRGEYGVWLTKNRKSVIEILFDKGSSMPSRCSYYVNVGQGIPEGTEFDGEYRKTALAVSTCRVSWKKIDSLYVPIQIEMTRGIRGRSIFITQNWVFADWKLGKSVDSDRLDKAKFLSGPSAFDLAEKLRLDFVNLGLR